MVARIVIAVGVGLIAATTWAAEPLRFVTEPESTAMPVPADPADEADAGPVAPEASDDVGLSPVRSTSRRRLRVEPPAPQAADDRDTHAEEAPPEPNEPAPPRVLHSTGKTKVVTIVRPKKPSVVVPSPHAIESHPARPIEEPAPLPLASNSSPKPRHLVPSAAANRSQGAPLAAGSSTSQSRPQPARKAARIAVTPDAQPVSDYPQPARAKTRHLLPPSGTASQPAASDVAAAAPADVSSDAPADKPTARRRASAAPESRESTSLASAARQPALLAEDPSFVSQQPTAPLEEHASRAAESFRFQLSEEGATSVARAANAARGEQLETSNDSNSQTAPELEFRTAAKPAAPPTLVESKPLKAEPEGSPAALHQAPLAMRLDALHARPTKRAAKAKPTEVASLEGGTPAKAQPTIAKSRKPEPAAMPDEVAESATPPSAAAGPAAPAAKGTAAKGPVAKGSVVHFDRNQQIVRLIFAGTQLPPVGSYIKVQHTSMFGTNEFTMLRVVRVESGEVLARATTHARLQRLSRGDLAFYRPLPATGGSTRAASIARAPITARETVWK